MRIYVVRAGDTPESVARRFSRTAAEVAAINALRDPTRLTPGLALAIPAEETLAREERVVNAYAFPTLRAEEAAAQMESFSLFCPFGCAVTVGGELREIGDGPLAAAARRGGAAPLLTVTNRGEDGSFSADRAHALFSDSAAQETLLSRLLERLEEKEMRGVNFHFAYVYPFDREGCSAFLRRASEALHRAGKLVTTALEPKESEISGGIGAAAQDYAVHGACSDWVTLMSYDWGYAYSAPQAVSPVDRIRRVLDYAVERIPRQKLLLGCSNYAYNWTLPWREGEAAQLMSNSAAMNLAISRGAEIRYDPVAAAPFFRYTDPAHIRHEVWFEDARSVKARLALVEEYALGGVSYWTVNFPNPMMLAVQRDCFAAAKLG